MAKLKRIPHLSGFVIKISDFLKEYAVMGVAIGVIVAQAAKDFVTAVVDGILMPAILGIFKIENLNQLSFSIKNTTFSIGAVISSFFTLSVVVIFLYLVVRRLVRLENEVLKQKK